MLPFHDGECGSIKARSETSNQVRRHALVKECEECQAAEAGKSITQIESQRSTENGPGCGAMTTFPVSVLDIIMD
jgi:hypothetical protein